MPITRRRLLGQALTTAALLKTAAPSLAKSEPQVVVVGGGAGGLSAARHLARAGVAVTLIEQNPRYTACFLSNAALGGLRPLTDFEFGYQGAERAGVRVVIAKVSGIDREARRLHLSDGSRIAYDRLILSPGIAFVEGSVPGWSESDSARMPHAWKAEPELARLIAQIDAMPEGGTFGLIAPPAPYRCPPGPYERVSMVAHRLSRQNPRAKIMIFDPKENYSKQTLFENAWERLYPGMIERLDPLMGGDLIEVRPGSMEVLADGEGFALDVCNVIPAQRAGDLASEAGLCDESGWAPVDAAGFTSRIDPNIRVIGDAAAQGAMPKSAFAASTQALVAAQSLLAELGHQGAGAGQLANICYSLIAPDEGLKVGGDYEAQAGATVSVRNFISDPSEGPEALGATAAEAAAWYQALTGAMFG